MEFIQEKRVLETCLPNIRLQRVLSESGLSSEEITSRLKSAEVKFVKSSLTWANENYNVNVLRRLKEGYIILRHQGNSSAKIYLIAQDEQGKKQGFKMTVEITTEYDLENLWAQLDVKKERILYS